MKKIEIHIQNQDQINTKEAIQIMNAENEINSNKSFFLLLR